MSAELGISFFSFFKIPSDLVYTHVCVYSRGSPFPLSRLAYVTLTADGAPVDGCLAVFPRHKGRKNLSFILPFWIFGMALIINRDIDTVIFELGILTGTVFSLLPFFVRSVRVH
jgi:hypothetical protein